MTENQTASEVAAQVVADAAEVATHVVTKAAEQAAAVVHASNDTVAADERMTNVLKDALRDIFGEHTASGRFIDVTRIPLICKSIIDANDRLKAIDEKLDEKFVTIERIKPLERFFYGLIGAVGLSILSVAGWAIIETIKDNNMRLADKFMWLMLLVPFILGVLVACAVWVRLIS